MNEVSELRFRIDVLEENIHELKKLVRYAFKEGYDRGVLQGVGTGGWLDDLEYKDLCKRLRSFPTMPSNAD